MSFNGSGTFVVNSSGQPVVTGTVISSTAFNALTADLATGLSTCVTKDGQTATTVRVPFAFGISSTLTTDATSATTGSIITAGGISTQKALWVGTTSRHVGAATFDSTIASGAITSTGAVTGTRLMIGADSGASYLLNVSGSSTSSAVRAIVINTSNNAGAVTLLQVQNDATYALQMKIYSSTSASPNVGEILAGGGNLTLGGQSTVGLTLGTSGAATFASSVTATLFTATATGNNGLGLAASGKPAIYAAGTSEIMRFDFADTTTYMAGIGGAPVKIGTNIATFQVYGASSGGGFRFGRDSTKEGLIYHDGTNILFQSYTPSLGTFLTITGSTGAATFASSVTATLFTPTATGNNGLGLAAAGTPAIYVNGTTEAARFTTTGGLLVGTTGVPNGTSIYGSALVPVSFDRTRLCMAASSTSSLELVQFFNPNGQVGAISTSGSATAYTTSSDYRLKENVQPMTGGLATVAALKPVTYDWIRTGFAGEGFIAHELQAVIPAAVSGEKDAVDDKGEINPQGVDFGKIVPHLVAAIQELTTRLAALENK